MKGETRLTDQKQKTPQTDQTDQTDALPDVQNQKWWQKIYNAKIKYGWQWLIYFDLVFPVLLFVLALLPISGLNSSLANMFHIYMMYVINPFPDLATFTGIISPILHIALIGRAVWRRKWLDAVLCLLLFIMLIIFFRLKIDGTNLNYYILRFLDFGLGSF